MGIALILVVLIAGLVAVAKLAGGREKQPTFQATQRPPTTAATSGDDGEVPATPSAYADDGAVIKVASSFATGWLRRDLTAAAWHAGLKPLCTQTVAASLEGVDPLAVPASRTTAPAALVRRGDVYALVNVPMDTGTLSLTLVKQGNDWLVATVDWDPA